jgi:hypothetical protein
MSCASLAVHVRRSKETRERVRKRRRSEITVASIPTCNQKLTFLTIAVLLPSSRHDSRSTMSDDAAVLAEIARLSSASLHPLPPLQSLTFSFSRCHRTTQERPSPSLVQLPRLRTRSRKGTGRRSSRWRKLPYRRHPSPKRDLGCSRTSTLSFRDNYARRACREHQRE